MEQLHSFSLPNGDIEYIFAKKNAPCAFSDWRDYLLIADVVRECLAPEECCFSGITDFRGHFTVKGIRFTFDYDDCFGIFLSRSPLPPEESETAQQIMETLWGLCVSRKLLSGVPFEKHS